MNEEYNINSYITNKFIGKWRVYRGFVQYKEIGKYEFENCTDISNKKFYDEFRAEQIQVKDAFNDNFYIYLCREHHSLLIFSKNLKENKKVIRYSPSVSSEDLSGIMMNISISQKDF